MRQAILTVSAMCMFAALCEQLLSGSIYKRTIRMTLGLQVFFTTLSLLNVFLQWLN